MSDPSGGTGIGVAIWKIILMAAGPFIALLGVLWRGFKDLLDRIAYAHSHTRNVEERLRTEMHQRDDAVKTELNDRMERIEATLSNTATKDDVQTIRQEQRDGFADIRAALRHHNERFDRVNRGDSGGDH